jgi:hypothetical protein
MSVSQWVADKLHDLVGYSDKVVAEFIVDSARKATSPAALLSLLTDTDTIENTPKSYVLQIHPIRLLSILQTVLCT